MFALALALRLLVAPTIGFEGDLRLFAQWATHLADVGPHRFYATTRFADYPPGYLYVLWLLGTISHTPGFLLLKLPAILADLGVAWLAGVYAARLAPEAVKERWPVRALVAAGVLFNPAVIALSAVWGQVDAVPVLFMLASLLLLFTGRPLLRVEATALVLFAVAVAMKPQSGFVLPVMVYALYRRHVHGRPLARAAEGALAVAVSCVLSLAVWAVSGLAFGLGPVSLVRFYQDSASVYPVTSANAFNLWGVVGFWKSDTTPHLGVSALHLGTVLFLASAAIVLWRTHRAIERGAPEALALTVSAATVALLAFVLLTRMHERYLFPALILLAPLAFVRPLRLAYAGLSALFLLSLWYPFAFFNAQWAEQDKGVHTLRFDPWFRLLLGGFETDTWQKRVWSAGVVAIALLVAWRGLRWVAAELGQTRGDRLKPVTPPAPPLTERSSWGPYALVALTCLFGLITLRGETTPTTNLNDSAFQMQMVRWADGQIGDGRVPLDGWYPYLSLGSSFFHHYQSLPNTLTAYVARATGAGDTTAYLWLLYLLLALWPIAVYGGARLLGWGRWTAAGAAAVSPLLVSASGYGYEHGSYTWQGYGVYTQLWAMWTLPLAWGLTWRAVTRGRMYALAALALALTIAFHFITGYLALLTLPVWVLAGGRGYLRRLGRAALVGASSLVVAAWVLVPLVGDTSWTNRSEYYRGTIFNESYGAQKVLGWLFTGKLFDDGRFPVVTLLVAVGIVVCASRVREDTRARALLGAFALSLLLFFGRPTLGPVLDLLPGFGDVQIHRFVVGVHLAGILLAGVGLGWILRRVFALVSRAGAAATTAVAAGVAVAVTVALLAPAWVERARYDHHGAVLMRSQRAADATDGRDLDRLIAYMKAQGPGRAYAGLRGNWGADYKVGFVPVHVWLADRDVDAIGFTFRTLASLSTDVEAAFDEDNPAQYRMLGVRFLILPTDRTPQVPARVLMTSGRHRLWEVASGGYAEVVDRAAPVRADRTNLEEATRSWRASDLAAHGIYPGIAWAGAAGPARTFGGSSPPAGAAGTVVTQVPDLVHGVLDATVAANRRAVVLLKASFDPRWHVTVDGQPAKATMVAPSLVGVEVTPGRHVVRFAYRPVGAYPWLLGAGLLVLAALAVTGFSLSRGFR